jgi:sulfur-carrier protein
VIVQINLYATFRLIAGVKSIRLDSPDGTSIMEVIQEIVKIYPVLKNHWLDENGEIHAHVHVFLNGNDAAILPSGLKTPLKSKDTLDFFPPVAGGVTDR